MANYINYGTQQVDQDALMTNLADQVQTYVSNQPWSSKKKERFMNAYSDIMSRGITGADNSTGQWMISTGGDQIEYKDKKDKEAYEQAAYFIQQQMSGLRADVEAKEEEKKNLPVLNNEEFTTSFINQISNNLFGGRQFDTQNDWNSLDERGSNGLRASTNRANKLADELQKYSDSVTEDKYNFEGSPFKDINDFKTRLNTAITTLRNHDEANYTSALNAIGLKASDWFNDGSGDIYGQDNAGNNITYGQYNQALIAQQEKEAQQQALNAEYEAKANMGVLDQTAGIHSKEARISPKAYQEWLANTYGTGQKGFNGINNRISQLLESAYSGGLDSKGKKELGNLLYYVRTNNPNYKGLGFGQGTNISDDEWAELRTHTNSLSSITRENFVRLPWTTSDGRYTYADNQGNVYFLKPANHKKFNAPTINKSKAYQNYKNNFLSNTTKGIDAQQQKYLQQTGFTNADIAELSGIAMDIASIINPLPVSAAALGIGAAAARNFSRAQDPKDWSFGDYVQQGIDYATGALGALPLAGDAVLASKTIKNIAKWGKRAMTIPAISEMLMEAPEAKNALMKAINGQDLTVADWRHLGSFVRGLTGTHNITSSNRAARRALQKRGYDLSNQNSFLKKSGLWDTAKPTSQATVKVNVKGKEVEIPISTKSKEKLDTDLKKAGNDQAKKDAAIRKVEEVNQHITNEKLKPEDVTAIESSHLRNARFVPRALATTKNNYGRVETENRPNQDTFDSYLKSDRGLWDRFLYGSNRNLRRYDPITNVVKPTATQKTQKQSVVQESSNTPQQRRLPYRTFQPETKQQLTLTQQQQNNTLLGLPQKNSKEYITTRPQKNLSIRGAQQEYNSFIDSYGLNSKRPSKPFNNGYGKTAINEDKKLSFIDSQGRQTTIELKPYNGKYLVNIERIDKVGKTTIHDQAKSIEAARQKVAKEIYKQTKGLDLTKIATILQGYKKLGMLKQGGKITDNQVDNFLNQYK